MLRTFAITLTDGELSESGMELRIMQPRAPHTTPHPDGGYIVLCRNVVEADRYCQGRAASERSEVEVIKYSGYREDNGLILILEKRGCEGTMAKRWCSGSMLSQTAYGSDIGEILDALKLIDDKGCLIAVPQAGKCEAVKKNKWRCIDGCYRQALKDTVIAEGVELPAASEPATDDWSACYDVNDLLGLLTEATVVPVTYAFSINGDVVTALGSDNSVQNVTVAHPVEENTTLGQPTVDAAGVVTYPVFDIGGNALAPLVLDLSSLLSSVHPNFVAGDGVSVVFDVAANAWTVSSTIKDERCDIPSWSTGITNKIVRGSDEGLYLSNKAGDPAINDPVGGDGSSWTGPFCGLGAVLEQVILDCCSTPTPTPNTAPMVDCSSSPTTGASPVTLVGTANDPEDGDISTAGVWSIVSATNTTDAAISTAGELTATQTDTTADAVINYQFCATDSGGLQTCSTCAYTIEGVTPAVTCNSTPATQYEVGNGVVVPLTQGTHTVLSAGTSTFPVYPLSGTADCNNRLWVLGGQNYFLTPSPCAPDSSWNTDSTGQHQISLESTEVCNVDSGTFKQELQFFDGAVSGDVTVDLTGMLTAPTNIVPTPVSSSINQIVWENLVDVDGVFFDWTHDNAQIPYMTMDVTTANLTMTCRDMRTGSACCGSDGSVTFFDENGDPMDAADVMDPNVCS